ncbi:GNAT family N-acetyltransferase [Solimicrobium silvestre]|uniref:Acetyltransferase (GNAT) domain n=1 Tax=Solimicrobium silvestre TaxID=2099400 RepID=A0A2S9GTB2_9BURK|nr:GNAT family N-acetyltransferase [Solimicrobium silvestre]PRC90959.1 Acetyltransferase (GNAT) domain [Solimicrobium silvestre]
MPLTSFQRFRLVDLPPDMFEAWQKIAQDNKAFHSPFFSPYFARAVAEVAKDRCYVTVALQDTTPIGFFPFQFTNSVLGRAERIGLYLSDYNGYISSEKLQPEQLIELLEVSKIHQYSFDHLHEFQAKLGLNTEFIREGTATHLCDGFEAYWAERERISPKFTKDTMRCLHKISKEKGELRFEFHSPDLSDLQSLIQTKRHQYYVTGATDGMASQWANQCLTNLHAVQNKYFRGVLSKLYSGDQLISSHFGLLANGVFHYWFPVYEVSYSAYSPGRLLFYLLTKNAAQFGIACIDNGMGAQRHKSDFANHTYKLGVGTFRRNTARCLVIRAQDYIRYRVLDIRDPIEE